jgi:hypothetical protein
MARTHGVLRGMEYVNKSSINDGRFGRMFRWLPRETYAHDALVKLAGTMIQLEAADLVVPPKNVADGPEIAFKKVLKKKHGQTTLLDTAYGAPEPGDENPTIPAGYTYFGQFIDHDLTFDPNSSLQKQNDPDSLEDFRSPRLDLDSLYGRGPDDQPYLYKDRTEDGGGIRFLLGRQTMGPINPALPVMAIDPNLERPGELPRNVEGRALTGDPRNDENNIISQLQVVFLHFHNRVVDTLQNARPQLSAQEVFLEAQRIVRWHYQYLVLTDFLPRVVGQATWKRVYWGKGHAYPEPDLQFYKPKDGVTYMPVEFSVAAFRFGHSMVRPSYALRAGEATVGGDPQQPFAGDFKQRFHRIPIFSDERARFSSLDGFGQLFPDWEIDWNLFFCAGEMPTEESEETINGKSVLQVEPQDGQHATQPGYRIDTKLVDPLAMLPPNVAKSGNMPDGIPVLAFRNLLRGSAFALPSGQSVARALCVEPLTEAELWADSTVAEFADPKKNPFAYRAPLWYYILREAESVRKSGFENDGLGGHHLGPVGGSIVAEVLVGLAYHDHTSYLYQDATWTPAAEKDKSGFDAGQPMETVYDLIAWTTKGRMTFR